MCGIVGYVGPDEAKPILMEGLRRLEYRGYDSAGITLMSDDGLLETVKRPGKIARLESALAESHLSGSCGIAHTRWATHGPPNEANAHPHSSMDGSIALIHNGIIENSAVLKQKLMELGYEFQSDTDTEVVVHLIDEAFKANDTLEDAVAAALHQIEGAYGLVVISSRDPRKLVAARNGSPLLLGVGNEGEFFVASDVAAMLKHTRDVVYLDDGDYAVVGPDDYAVYHLQKGAVRRSVHKVTWDLSAIEKGGFDHFMLKEIFEQPSSIRDVLRGRLIEEEGISQLGGIKGFEGTLDRVDRIVITACGTSWHAGLIGEYMLEEMTGIPVKVEYASEFRYKNPVVDSETLVLAISQSGETADTLAALKEAKRRGAITMGIVNSVGSSIARFTDFGVYLHAGPEIGVASTKAFTSQIVALALFTLYMGRRRQLSILTGRKMVRDLSELPEKVEEVLASADSIRELATAYKDAPNFLYLGRGYQFPRCPRRGPQAQGSELHPRGGIPSGGDEARAHRTDRREHAGGVPGASGPDLREGRVEHRRGEGAQRKGDRGGHRGRLGASREGGSPDSGAADAPLAPARAHVHSTPAPRVPRGDSPGLRRGPTPQPGQVRHSRVTGPARLP